MNINNDNDFVCDECKINFSIQSGGFLGSLEDFEFQMTKKDLDSILEEQKNFECSPFLNYVSLCSMCFQKTKQ